MEIGFHCNYANVFVKPLAKPVICHLCKQPIPIGDYEIRIQFADYQFEADMHIDCAGKLLFELMKAYTFSKNGHGGQK